MPNLFNDIPGDDDKGFGPFMIRHFQTLSAGDKPVLQAVVAGTEDAPILTTTEGSGNHKLWHMFARLGWVEEHALSHVMPNMPPAVKLRSFQVTKLGRLSLPQFLAHAAKTNPV